jgi:hypothetical protein
MHVVQMQCEEGFVHEAMLLSGLCRTGMGFVLDFAAHFIPTQSEPTPHIFPVEPQQIVLNSRHTDRGTPAEQVPEGGEFVAPGG